MSPCVLPARYFDMTSEAAYLPCYESTGFPPLVQCTAETLAPSQMSGPVDVTLYWISTLFPSVLDQLIALDWPIFASISARASLHTPEVYEVVGDQIHACAIITGLSTSMLLIPILMAIALLFSKNISGAIIAQFLSLYNVVPMAVNSIGEGIMQAKGISVYGF